MKRNWIIYYFFILVIISGCSFEGESFYRDEYKLATELEMPKLAEFIEGGGEWGLTYGIFKLPNNEWNQAVKPLLKRAIRDRENIIGFNPEKQKSLGKNSDVFILRTKRRYVIISINEKNKMIFWEVWHS